MASTFSEIGIKVPEIKVQDKNRAAYRSDRRQLEEIFQLAVIQVKVWFVLSVIASILVFSFGMITIARFAPSNSDPISLMVTIITGMINALFFMQLRGANKRTDVIRDLLLKARAKWRGTEAWLGVIDERSPAVLVSLGAFRDKRSALFCLCYQAGRRFRQDMLVIRGATLRPCGEGRTERIIRNGAFGTFLALLIRVVRAIAWLIATMVSWLDEAHFSDETFAALIFGGRGWGKTALRIMVAEGWERVGWWERPKKYRPDDKAFTLHDEVQRMIEKYVLFEQTSEMLLFDTVEVVYPKEVDAWLLRRFDYSPLSILLPTCQTVMYITHPISHQLDWKIFAWWDQIEAGRIEICRWWGYATLNFWQNLPDDADGVGSSHRWMQPCLLILLFDTFERIGNKDVDAEISITVTFFWSSPLSYPVACPPTEG